MQKQCIKLGINSLIWRPTVCFQFIVKLNKTVSFYITQRHIANTASVVAFDVPPTRRFVPLGFTIDTGEGFMPWVSYQSVYLPIIICHVKILRVCEVEGIGLDQFKIRLGVYKTAYSQKLFGGECVSGRGLGGMLFIHGTTGGRGISFPWLHRPLGLPEPWKDKGRPS